MVDEECPAWRQEVDEMGLETPSRTSKAAELVNGDLRGSNGLRVKEEECRLI